jgi:hypothetical protein
MSTEPDGHRWRPSPEDIQPMTEDMLRQERDWRWALSDRERRLKYAGQIVAVYCETVWGVGRDHPTVMANALAALEKAAGKPGVPTVDDLTFVVMPDWFTYGVSAPAS